MSSSQSWKIPQDALDLASGFDVSKAFDKASISGDKYFINYVFFLIKHKKNRAFNSVFYYLVSFALILLIYLSNLLP